MRVAGLRMKFQVRGMKPHAGSRRPLRGRRFTALALLVLAACSGGPRAGGLAGIEGPLDLEVAVRAGAQELAAGALATIGSDERARVAVVALASSVPAAAASSSSTASPFGQVVADHLLTELQRAGEGRLELVEREYLPQIFEDLDRYENDDAAAKRLLRTLGARYLATGRYTALDDRILLNLRIVDVERAAAVSTSAVAVRKTPALIALLADRPSAPDKAAPTGEVSTTDAASRIVTSLLASLGDPPPGTKAAVAELTTPDRERSKFGRMLAERMQTELTKGGAGRFPVYERRRIDALEEEGEAFANRKLDVLTKKMGVTLLLTGTYSPAGERVFVEARLLDPASGQARAAASADVRVDDDLRRLLGEPVGAAAPKVASLGDDVVEILADSGAATDVQVEIWPDRRAGATYHPGENVTFSFRASADAYVMILDQQTSGNVYTLFPNCFTADNRVRGGRVYTIPAPADGYYIQVDGPPGIERLKAIASTRPLPLTDPPLCKQESFRSIAPSDKPRFRDLRIRQKEIPASQKATANTWLNIE